MDKRAFFHQMRGSYWGVVVDKKNGEVLTYSDHIGSKQIFYAESEESLIVSSNSYELTRHLKEHKTIKPTLNTQAAYFILDFGYTIEDLTIVNEISRLIPGYYLIKEENEVEVREFYRVSKEPSAISDEEAIEGIDRCFRKAVGSMFDKDKEYGYRHLVALSGGLDSRMTSYVAHDMGYTDQLNITFSQNGYLDEKIAKEIASDLRHEWMFKSLDNGVFLKNIDETTKLTGGNTNYFGVAHGSSLLDNLDFSNYGILHSGQFGNSIVGTFGNPKKLDAPFALVDLVSDPQSKKKVSQYELSVDYPDLEFFLIYNRCLIAGNNGLLPTQSKSESISPFYDLEFWEFCLSIPVEQRAYHRLYKMWINKKYPEAAKYIWEQTKASLNSKLNVKIKGASYSSKQLWNFFLRKTVFKLRADKKEGMATKNHMNPIEYWFSTNSNLDEFYHDYVDQHLQHLDVDPELKEYVESLSKEGKPLDYAKILTLLSAAKLIAS
jgi:asparagine synthase (glutamine-hydrolysing)